MMKPTTILLTVITLLMTSCTNLLANKTVNASGPDITGTIEAMSITEINASQAIVVNYTVGPTVSVKYTVPESLAKYLEITCTKGTLKCKYKDGINPKLDNRQVTVDVTAPNISEFDASSAARINVKGTLAVQELEADASSAASITIENVKANKADLESSSAGIVTISNLTAQSVDLDTSSSASLNIAGTLGNVNVEVSSAATAKIAGTCDVLNVDASSAGSVDASSATISTGHLEASSGATVQVSEATGTPYKTDKNSGGSISIR